MNIKYLHHKLRDSIQRLIYHYEEIAISMSITFELEELMKAKGISKIDLAKAAGVSISKLNKVFCGDSIITLKMLAGIAQKYNVRFSFNFKPVDSKFEPIDNLP